MSQNRHKNLMLLLYQAHDMKKKEWLTSHVKVTKPMTCHKEFLYYHSWQGMEATLSAFREPLTLTLHVRNIPLALTLP